ncbi:MAG: zinc-ribbon domain-containing protein [Candidatus Bathyarchaeia archaeon]
MGEISLVYCTKCGTKNEDDAKVCIQCGTQLEISRFDRKYHSDECFGPHERRHIEYECFGLPYGGALIGIIFGLIIVFIGLAILLGFTNIWNYMGPLIIVIVGVLIIAGALYGMRRSY